MSDLPSICAAAITVLVLLWIFIPILSGIPWVPTPERRIRRALEMAGLKKGQVFYDLGCGDGRVLIAAAQRFGVRAVGIEISPLHCLAAKARAVVAGVGDQVTIRWGNIFTAKFSDADAVFSYVRGKYARRLQQRLEGQLKPGARFVSAIVDLPGWQPDGFDQEQLLFLYRMPAHPGSLADFLALSVGIEPKQDNASQAKPPD